MYVLGQVVIELAEGHPQIAGTHELHAGRQNANDGVALIVERNAAANYTGIPAVTALPQAMPQDHDRSTSRPVLFPEKRPSRRGANPQHWKKPGVGIACFNALRFTLARKIKPLGIARVSSHV